jgi:hypothetical protein
MPFNAQQMVQDEEDGAPRKRVKTSHTSQEQDAVPVHEAAEECKQLPDPDHTPLHVAALSFLAHHTTQQLTPPCLPKPWASESRFAAVMQASLDGKPHDRCCLSQTKRAQSLLQAFLTMRANNQVVVTMTRGYAFSTVRLLREMGLLDLVTIVGDTSGDFYTCEDNFTVTRLANNSLKTDDEIDKDHFSVLLAEWMLTAAPDTHVLMVDDSPERDFHDTLSPERQALVDIWELPHEQRGLTEFRVQQLQDRLKGVSVMVSDVDCTITVKHMFKMMENMDQWGSEFYTWHLRYQEFEQELVGLECQPVLNQLNALV